MSNGSAPASIGPVVNTELIIDALLSAPAGTYSVTGQPFRGAGYVVAVKGTGRVLEPHNTPTTADVYRHMRSWIHHTAAPSILRHPAPFYRPRYFGVWINNGTVYLDVVEIFQDRDEAVAAGRDRNQIAIWDAGNGVEIATDGTGAVD